MMQQSSFFQKRKAMINRIKQWFQFPASIITQDDIDITDNQEQLSDNDLSSETKVISSSLETNIVPQVKDADLEYLFHQLLEGIVNGWQEKRVMQFLQKLEPKVSQENWLEWLQRYRRQLLASPSPHHQLAERMKLLGKLQLTTSIPFVKTIATSVDEISQELFDRRIHLFTGNYFSLSNTTEASSLVSNYQIQGDEESSSPSKSNIIVSNITSVLQNNPLLKLNEDEISEQQDSVDSAQIAQETSSDTQSALTTEFTHSKIELPLINDDVYFDSESGIVTEDIDSDSDSENQAVFSPLSYSLSAEDIFGLALEKAQAGDFKKALSLWQKVVTLEPDFAPAWHNLGSTFAHFNRLTEAIECFDKALAININDYLSWNDRGNALFRLQRWHEAIVSWDRVIGIKPDFEQAWYHRGLALEKLEEYADAIISYKQCLNINPEFQSAKKRYEKIRLSTLIVKAGKRGKTMDKK